MGGSIQAKHLTLRVLSGFDLLFPVIRGHPSSMFTKERILHYNCQNGFHLTRIKSPTTSTPSISVSIIRLVLPKNVVNIRRISTEFLDLIRRLAQLRGVFSDFE